MEDVLRYRARRHCTAHEKEETHVTTKQRALHVVHSPLSTKSSKMRCGITVTTRHTHTHTNRHARTHCQVFVGVVQKNVAVLFLRCVLFASVVVMRVRKADRSPTRTSQREISHHGRSRRNTPPNAKSATTETSQTTKCINACSQRVRKRSQQRHRENSTSSSMQPQRGQTPITSRCDRAQNAAQSTATHLVAAAHCVHRKPPRQQEISRSVRLATRFNVGLSRSQPVAQCVVASVAHNYSSRGYRWYQTCATRQLFETDRP
jgi:hypothetical protein